MKTLKKIFEPKWKVIRTIWPYAEGYGTYKEDFFGGKRTLLDTGLTKEEAQRECDKLNNEL